MDFVRLTEEERNNVLDSLNENQKKCLQTAESILQTIAGVYINRPGNSEMADLYRNAASTLSDWRLQC